MTYKYSKDIGSANTDICPNIARINHLTIFGFVITSCYYLTTCEWVKIMNFFLNAQSKR